MSIRTSLQPELLVTEGDCLDLLREVRAGSVDLAYMDPPFSTGRTQAGRQGHAFEDRWSSTAEWVEFMRPRVEAVLGTLSRDGSILVHCDWRTSHHVRIMLDELLGESCFQNHLVWQYGLGGSSPRRFARKHDDILFYSVSPTNWYFEPPMIPATSNRMKGMLKKATDILDVPSINNMARERTGWPTQKPLALLELLVQACCPPGGRVLDPMCGSGTTLVAAAGTGRSALGFDRLAGAVTIARERLAALSDQQLQATPQVRSAAG
ncbi:MAG: site-specific DNA-methyltransferase [Planctomycetota bacterium]|nr:site-specific DNA-methyltransferase [Planctomycetota bacterium]